jgi:thiol-disulfide isomerase/thioredoxin
MIRSFLFFALSCCALPAWAGTFTLTVTARGFGEDVVSLYRYDDLFTLRTILITRSILGDDGRTTLSGEVEGTTRVQLRIGDRIGDLYVRPESHLQLEAYDLGAARSMSGTTRLGLTFMDLDPLDINALTSDLNERIDAFIEEDLATDEVAGMQAVDIQRKNGKALPDSSQRPPTLFVTPELSAAKVDSFATTLRRFYVDVQDPWFAHYLHYSIAGLSVGPKQVDRQLFEAHVKGKPVRYDDPEYVRFIRNLFTDGLQQLARYHSDTLAQCAALGNKDALRRLFQRNDFLRDDDRLAELVMIDRLYLEHGHKVLSPVDAERILYDVMVNSTFTEHQRIAANMLWDLTTMRVGSALPEMRLEDERGQPVVLNDLLDGPTCIAFTAGWCTACAVEIAGLVKLGAEYPGVVRIIVIDLDRSLEASNATRKSTGSNDFVWLHAVAEQQVREDLRLRSLPAFYVLNDGTLARSPAPAPSKGLGALFNQAKVNATKDKRIKVWDD